MNAMKLATLAVLLLGARAHAVDGLAAHKPQPDMFGDRALFSPLIGEWEVESVVYSSDGSELRQRGAWNFGWVLDGRAVQDVLVIPSRGARAGKTEGQPLTHGTSIRAYDPDIAAWRATYVDPVRNVTLSQVTRQENDRIVQEGVNGDGVRTRWVFFDIRRDAFTWRAESSGDHGKTWKVDQEIHAVRKTDDDVPHWTVRMGQGAR